MRLKLILVCAMVTILPCLVASSPQVSVDVPCDDFEKYQHISKEVEVGVGDSFTVALCSNPTTGFNWSEEAQISDQTLLQQTDHKFVDPTGGIGCAGAAGKEMWTFKALKKGTSSVSMEYSRPWEGDEKGAWTFNLTAVIQ
ncbi:MAG: protease inhibitor I42 family protein [Dehalococcoidia bacterium]|jgi:inhibitor of cysteine peptidase